MFVIRKIQVTAFRQASGLPLTLNISPLIFTLGKRASSSLGLIRVRILLSNGTFMPIIVDFVKTDVPLLLALDIMHIQNIHAKRTENMSISKNHGWKLQLIKINGHVFLQWKFKTSCLQGWSFKDCCHRCRL